MSQNPSSNSSNSDRSPECPRDRIFDGNCESSPYLYQLIGRNYDPSTQRNTKILWNADSAPLVALNFNSGLDSDWSDPDPRTPSRKKVTWETSPTLLPHFVVLSLSNSRCIANERLTFCSQLNNDSMYGQCLDMMFNRRNQKPRFDMFTFDRYQTLVEHKATIYTFCLPGHLARHLNDYLDCFGNPEVTGKFGNDIGEGKCTWFSVKFLEEASEPTKKQFLVESDTFLENQDNVTATSVTVGRKNI
ncbi:hypothetical protein AVEN_142948-1 [Araneus ventricosus]|uniref:Uncharacterized protein n=1 Tax=Araneus ventricosus TaxID=182803 RepID=A0A4Y2M5U5_ARAVE|nr:hypothetical protein AVEN_142948-1 [Araneus ventricosus]